MNEAVSEEKKLEEKKQGFIKVIMPLKDVRRKNLTFVILGAVLLFLIIIIGLTGLTGQRAPTPQQPSFTPSPPHLPQLTEISTPGPKLSALEEEIRVLKEKLAKINLSDPNLAFPNLDFVITLKPK